MEETDTRDILGENAAKLGFSQIQGHLSLCRDRTKPKCCDREEGLEVWDYLNKRLSELELDRPSADRPGCIFRNKANCLRVCSQGPILLVYPEGVWYGRVNKEAIERIVQEHLIGNPIVTEYAFLGHDLPAISLNCLGDETETIEENRVKTS